MTQIVVVSDRPERLESFCRALEATPDVQVHHVGTAAAALETARLPRPPALMVIDDPAGKVSHFSLAAEILSINAWIHIAMVSDLDKREFHDAYEGLGILMQLPPEADETHARQLLNKLKDISALQ